MRKRLLLTLITLLLILSTALSLIACKDNAPADDPTLPGGEEPGGEEPGGEEPGGEEPGEKTLTEKALTILDGCDRYFLKSESATSAAPLNAEGATLADRVNALPVEQDFFEGQAALGDRVFLDWLSATCQSVATPVATGVAAPLANAVWGHYAAHTQIIRNLLAFDGDEVLNKKYKIDGDWQTPVPSYVNKTQIPTHYDIKSISDTEIVAFARLYVTEELNFFVRLRYSGEDDCMVEMMIDTTLDNPILGAGGAPYSWYYCATPDKMACLMRVSGLCAYLTIDSDNYAIITSDAQALNIMYEDTNRVDYFIAQAFAYIREFFIVGGSDYVLGEYSVVDGYTPKTTLSDPIEMMLIPPAVFK